MNRARAWAATMIPAVTLGAVLAMPTALAQDSAEGDRGRYLVHHVAMCVQCHSPRDRQGQLIESRLLQGAPMPLASPFREPWALAVPQIAGLPGFTGEDVVTLLTTGARPDGSVPMPPMPSFRMTSADARAVVSYLQSLGGDRRPRLDPDTSERPQSANEETPASPPE